MRRLKLKDSKNQLTVNDILIVQKQFGITLPSMYNDFLLLNNGGVGYYTVKTTDEGFSFSIRSFFSIEDDNVITSAQNMFRAVSDMFDDSKSWFPFGDDFGDWLFCLCLKPDNYGTVYLMRTDETEEEEAFIFVCNSFEEFIDGLSPYGLSVR